MPRSMFWDGKGYMNWNGSELIPGAREKDDHYLQLDKNETDMIKTAAENFEKVVVVLNSPTAMELGFLDDDTHYAYSDKIQACVWIGTPGNTGIMALGRVLTGKVNPSGRTVDIYARNFENDPTWNNFGNNLADGGNQYVDESGTKRNAYFVHYSEGIYYGYRYYETRAYEESAKGNDGWYSDNVVYPFGYGKSYTEFNWEIKPLTTGALQPDGEVKFEVKVTNVGDYAGKDVVELYYSAPYTAGGIEKAHAVLGDYAKTNTIQPGESDTVTLTLKVRDMASYDYSDANGNGVKGYELEAGDYTFFVARNSHDYSNSTVLNLAEGAVFETDSKTTAKVANLFDEVSDRIKKYTSRADFEGTFPGLPAESLRTLSDEDLNKLNYKLSDKATDPWYSGSKPVQSSSVLSYEDTKVKLYDLIGKKYDDPLWGELLNQLTVSQMRSLIESGNYHTTAITNIDKPKTIDPDGPMGYSLFMGDDAVYDTCYYASESLVGSTWNVDIAEEFGVMIGNESLIGDERGDKRTYAGWYAPACNMHRSPFGGRNFEYYSEDALLSGEMAGQIVRGCNDKGMVTFVKHFAVNDQESNRDTLLTWANEQTIREIYLRPFQICVEKYNSHGIMSALNSLGAVWTGGHYALLTEVLRNEWGFKGVVITDYVQNRGQLNGNMALRAGGDILLATDGSVQTPVGLDRPTTIANLRRAAHNLYYTIVNHTAAFNAGTVNVFGSFAGGDLSPAIDSLPYEQSVATVTLNNGKSAEDVTYELKEVSKLPEGLTLSSEGVISGTAKLQSEAAEFTVVAKYGYAEREATYTLPMVDKSLSVIYIRESETINGSVSGGFNESIDWAYTLDGKKHEITYKLAEGCILPEGLSLSENGVISGKSAIPFTGYEITVIAESAGMLPMRVRLTLNSYKDFSFASSVLPTARCGRQYAQSVTAVSDGTLKYSLKLGSTLPQGLSLTAGGTVVGVPQEAGVSSFTVVVTGANCPTTEKTFTLSVGINYSTFSLGNATVGVQYETYVNTAQGAVDIGYTLTGGKLPRGVTLSRDGVLSGTPKESGNFAFTVTAAYGDYSDSVELVLHVDEPASNAAYVAGLTVGVIGIAGVVAACVVYVLVIDKRAVKNENGELLKEGARVTVKQKIKRNKSFVGFAGAAVCVMMAVVITCGVVFAPVSQSGGTETYTFEAEYVYLDDFMGAGISNSGEGVNNIYGEGSDEDKAKGWSNGYFLGNTYAVNSITFEITSDRNAEGKLILRLASELGALALNNEVFGIAVNGKEVDYSFTVANSAAGSYDFADYPVAAEINLAEGVNEITLSIKENTLKDGNGIGAPLIDCIKITTEAGLSWNPLTDNPDNRGKI